MPAPAPIEVVIKLLSGRNGDRIVNMNQERKKQWGMSVRLKAQQIQLCEASCSEDIDSLHSYYDSIVYVSHNPKSQRSLSL